MDQPSECDVSGWCRGGRNGVQTCSGGRAGRTSRGWRRLGHPKLGPPSLSPGPCATSLLQEQEAVVGLQGQSQVSESRSGLPGPRLDLRLCGQGWGHTQACCPARAQHREHCPKPPHSTSWCLTSLWPGQAPGYACTSRRPAIAPRERASHPPLQTATGPSKCCLALGPGRLERGNHRGCAPGKTFCKKLTLVPR